VSAGGKLETNCFDVSSDTGWKAYGTLLFEVYQAFLLDDPAFQKGARPSNPNRPHRGDID